MDRFFPPSFHPRIAPWFLKTYGDPTSIQAAAWPVIAEGRHVLALAPTGSGKTLAAFLDALSRFATGEYDADVLSVLYVSPLKALNEDIRRNLKEPLDSLRAWFEKEGEIFPGVRVETRSGDTSPSDRRRFLTHPPSILATTPESLAILLASPRARPVLAGVRLVILDEVHAILDSKRGAFLACQIGALSLLAGEFQRVALSATVNPPEAAAEFVGGRRRLSDPRPGTSDRYESRPVALVNPPAEKRIELAVDFPSPSNGAPWVGEDAGVLNTARYGALVQELADRTRRNRSTLVFTDSRRRAERIAFLLNEASGTGTAYAHHGSLSKEVRRLVEERLKQGDLPCVVATGSLELGIDIGTVDEVVLAGTPGAVAPALQRVGRSGHGVGRTSRGTVFPFHGTDLLRSAALAGAVRDREIESIGPIRNPLDILAQAILSLCALEPRNVDSLYEDIRSFPPFFDLPRESYDRVVEMLAGRYESARLRDLKPRLRYDRLSGSLSAADGTLPLLYSSGGAIPDRGVYSLRLADGTRIGELDEEFVWERRVGDAFSFGTRSWRITEIGPEAVEVAPLGRPADFVPFWKAETQYRSPVLVRRTLEILESFESGEGPDAALGDLGMTERARSALKRFLEAQKNIQGDVPLPGPHAVSLELCADSALRGDAVTAVLHTLRGGAVNGPLALALSAELEESTGLRIEAIADDDFVLIIFPVAPGISPEREITEALRRLGDAHTLETRVRGRLESSGVFGEAFRGAAGRSLLLPRAGFGKRTPLWITRLRAKRLFDAVSPFGDFPVIAEAWRSCLVDLFDMDGLTRFCADVARGSIRVGTFRTRVPSPFAREAVWQETNRFLYEGDQVEGRRGASLSDKAIEDAVASARLRPALAEDLVADFVSRLRRERAGWAPDDGSALAEWVKERVLIPGDEWELLRERLGDAARDALNADPSLGSRLFVFSTDGDRTAIVHEERRDVLEGDALTLLEEWLRYEGPVSASRVAEAFGVTVSRAREALEALVEAGTVSSAVRVAGNEDSLFCDAANLELLLRRTRKAARSRVEERPLADLPAFLAGLQGLAGTSDRPPWETLSGWTAPVRLWETEFLPARLPDYRSSLLDLAFEAGRCLWFGTGKEIVGLCSPEDLDLSLPERLNESALVPQGILDFWEARDGSGLSTDECERALWAEAWKGLISSDTWDSLRAGLPSGFGRARAKEMERPLEEAAFGQRRRIPRALRERWKGGAPVRGRWFSLAADDAPDPLEREDLDRERVRVLGRRWGVICRPLLERELPAFGWSRLLPVLRRMELAGELLAGRFFAGLGGLQFMPPEAYERFLKTDEKAEFFWMNACDPASLAGVEIEGLPDELPPRVSSTRFAYRGKRLAAVSLRNGREVRVLTPPDSEDSVSALSFLVIPKKRAVLPERKVVVEIVNGEPAARNPFTPALRELGFEPDRGKMVLW